MTEAQQLIIKVGICRLINPDEPFEEILKMCGITIEQLKTVLEEVQ